MQALIAAKKFKNIFQWSLITLLIGGFYSCKKSAECTCDNTPWGKETYSYSKLSKKEIEQTRTNCLAYGNCVWTELE